MKLSRQQLLILVGVIVLLVLGSILFALTTFWGGKNSATPTAAAFATVRAEAQASATALRPISTATPLPTPTPRIPTSGEVLSAISAAPLPTPSVGQPEAKSFLVTSQITVKDIIITKQSTARVFPNPTLKQTYSCSVVLYAGVNLAELQQSDVEVASATKVTIKLPQPRILGAEGETVYSSQTNVTECTLIKEECSSGCVGIGLQEKNEVRAQATLEARKIGQEEAIKSGFLTKAADEVKRLLENIVKRLNFTDINFK